MKLLNEEPETPEFSDFIEDPQWTFISSELIETEMRRAAIRLGKPLKDAVAAIERLNVIEIPKSAYRMAGVLEGKFLRSLDAIHLAMVLAAEADFLCAYDTRLVEAALAVGIPVLRPGFSEF